MLLAAVILLSTYKFVCYNTNDFKVITHRLYGDIRMEFLFTQRGAGKRAIKPSKDIAFLEDQIAAESSDDSEYKVEGASDDDSNGDTDGSSSSSNENSDHDISDEGETPKDDVEALSKDDHENLTTKDLLALARKELDHNDIPKWVGKVKICGCCLGQTSTDANEIVECDGCGISVHEGCYGIRETAGSVASTVSSASTEPWFCEVTKTYFFLKKLLFNFFYKENLF